MPDRKAQLDLYHCHTMWKNGELAQAESCCRRIVSATPDFAEANHLLGLILKQSKNISDAEKFLKLSIEQSQDNAEFRTNLANFYRSQSRFEESLQLYLSALQCNPHFRPAKIALLRLLNIIDPKRSADLARQFLAQATADAELWGILGQALKSTGDLSNAEKSYRKSIELNPKNAITHHNLGALLSQVNRAEEALDELRKAEDFGLKTSELEYNRASALLALNCEMEAELALHRSLELNPHSADSHMMLANLRFMRGDNNYLDTLEANIKKNPEQSRLWAVYGNLLRDSQNIKASVEVLKEGIRVCGQKTEISLALTTTLLEDGQYQEALIYAKDAAGENPNDLNIKSTLASSLLSNSRPQEAKTLITQLREAAPLNQEYIALEAVAARLLQDPFYHELYNFNAFVQTFDIEPPAGWQSITDFHRDLIPELESRHRFSAHPLNQSLRSGTQTAQSLLADRSPIIRAFLQSLSTPLEEYRNSIGFTPDHPFRSRSKGKISISGCWSVRLGANGFHVNHIHPQGWVSSVYYVEVPEEISNHSKKCGWLKLGEPRFHVPNAGPEWFVEPTPGKLVLFPSYMWHGTIPFISKKSRLTIAFDAVTDT
ncbi:putative 2OG-Fe(II) oxygenase [Microbulbifer pacificus]|uniref:putative 2OG-Fe(II) oxygenase n=1 Tax=Microbulbifer pacificus TaxID=407164 RepID=UPI00131A0E4E|nr:putative 2OG-Fe(II) oxygenase [Microbulbifer pacificus]